ncbi:uncharacterized protein LOC144492856 [Mustelus asterias]
MGKQVYSLLVFILFLNLSNSLTLIVPEEVTGQLRKSVSIPCTYRPSPLYVEEEVIWYFNTYAVILQRNKFDNYIHHLNRGRISIKHDPGSGDVSLTLKNLAYSDRGIYTCEVRWRSKHGLNQTKESASVHLIVLRALSSTRAPASVLPVFTPMHEFNNMKIPVWVFVLTVTLIILIFLVIVICIVLWKRMQTGTSEAAMIFNVAQEEHTTGHLYELPSVRYESLPYPAPMNVILTESNEYEVMTAMRENEYAAMRVGSACVLNNQMLRCEE